MGWEDLECFEDSVTDLILMCRNIPVYNVDKERVLEENLLPGLMRKSPCKHTFKEWMKLRYSALSNSLARKLRGIAFRQGGRLRINVETGAFSLSDCYWLCYDRCGKKFEQLSPYFQDFWKGDKKYEGEAIPTLYVSGALNKCWVSAEKLLKYGDGVENEILAVQLCQVCDVACNKIVKVDDGICIENFTNTEIMLEQADASGVFEPEDFINFDIIKTFGERGIEMLAIDAISANTDRHAGNFGFLRSAATGEYLGMAPLYDFDQILGSESQEDSLIRDLIQDVREVPEFRQRVIKIAKAAAGASIHPLFTERANVIIKKLV